VGVEFNQLPDRRRVWLLQTGSRYIWRNEKVISSRKILYQNLSNYSLNAHDYVVDKIARTVEKYLQAFNLVGSSDIFG
jgi:hypothetical protein